MIEIETSVENLSGIGSAHADKLQKLGIRTVRDLLFHFPARYDDLSQITPISELEPGQTATVIGKITGFEMRRSWKKRMDIIEASIEDSTGTIGAIWFNQKYLIDSFSRNPNVRLSGKIKHDPKKGLVISNPVQESASTDPTHTGRIVPIYPETRGITSRWLRWQIGRIFKMGFEIKDPLPEEILKKYRLPSLKKALYDMHYPSNDDSHLVAQKRFAFFDMLLIQLKTLQLKKHWKGESAQKIGYKKEEVEKFLKSLPFRLTRDQKKAFEEIRKDLERAHPMNRLLNGDVGSGKTIVSALATLQSSGNGFQSAIMAPTEVLAYQHFENFSKLFSGFDFNIGLLTNSYRQIVQNSKFKIQNSSSKSKNLTRSQILKAIKEGNVDIIIGTHALIQKDIRFKNLALIIIDEQHRFGVMQRAYLQQKSSEINDGMKNKLPHLLTMSATPIPRTISMTLLGSLDVSLITQMPEDRKPIITRTFLPKKQPAVYEFVRQEIKRGRQAFVILPLVEESDKLAEVKAATTEHKRLSEEVFPELKLSLLHGRMKPSEKEKIMMDFKGKKTDILVSTSVIEVGIDIPNATVMIIEEAYRFGLSQLHQFRGRVGRGSEQSYCFLFSKQSTKRLGVLDKYSDGFKIAQEDLKLRGPGDFFGFRQSGLADSTMQNITNIKMIKFANEEARDLLKKDPELKKHPALSKEIDRMSENIHLE
ncbi:MAG: ATP-dependent DNA helicase RecG [Parcubacteria group bacterium]|jgi:ATP-dependent DNA helicase RecG|nr:ATP-dependent DNA helicase RecG [Candidatus Moranbacteria bacterium]MDX9856015.1 ATP-dependent DNA helicase RecG [Candidatus Moranbacteria bacterium]